MSASRKTLAQEFGDREYRHAYAQDFLDTSIATQLKALREQAGWTQTELAQEAGMRQSRISVLENVNYSSWSINTLRKLAEAFDVALVVRFESFGELIEDISTFSIDRLSVPPFEKDPSVETHLTGNGSSEAEDVGATPSGG